MTRNRRTARSVEPGRGPDPVITVIGGSTPFCAAFGAALHGSALSGAQVRLLGRDASALDAVSRHLRDRYGLRAEGCRRVSTALSGADLVIAQPRPGGLRERARDERFAASFGAAADEGLGLGGVRAALRISPVMAAMAATVRELCPRAWFLVLTNPLSVAVSAAAREHGGALGFCELPVTTAAEAAALLDIPASAMDWQVTGLNHRVLLHGLADLRRPDLMPDLLARLEREPRTAAALGGLDAATVAGLGALPTKYHGLSTGRVRTPAGRAEQLQALRGTAIEQLAAEPGRPPAALAGRSMPWYPVLVDGLEVLLGRPGTLVLDLPDADRLTRTYRCAPAEGGTVRRVAATPPPAPAAAWLRQVEEGEALLLDLVDRPEPDRLRAVLAHDPAIPDAAVGPATEWLLGELAAASALLDRPDPGQVPPNPSWFAA